MEPKSVRTVIKNKELRQARLKRHWTQRRLAEELNVAIDTVRAWERGTNYPSLEAQERLSQVLNIELPAMRVMTDEPQSQEAVVSPLISVLPERSQNELRMIRRVRALWIHGVLEQSLYKAALIELGLYEQPDAVENPWRLALQEANLPSQELPAGTKVIGLYDRTGGDLLILGEPGAGKTTLLLELLRELLNRAQQDGSLPIPVMFNLSSWAMKHLPFIEWLVEELNSKYQVPVKIGRAWVAQDQVQLLLDGLDEVDAAQRGACIAAINTYRQQHGLVPVIVCSRKADYLVLEQRLLLHTAVVVQPLTFQQVSAYLAGLGKSLTALHEALQHDPTLQEMALSPLMLNILALTYSGKSEVFGQKGTLAQRHTIVLQAYIERVLMRRGKKAHYSIQQTMHYLACLARQMQKYSQTEFYIERMQPDWLPTEALRHRYQNVVVWLIFGMHCLVVSGLYALFRGDSEPHSPGLFYWLGGGIGDQLLGWMAPGIGGDLRGSGSLGIAFALAALLVILLAQLRTPKLSLSAIQRGLSSGLRNGLIAGVVVGGFTSLVFGFSGGLSYGLFRGSGIGLLAALLVGLLSGTIALLQQEKERGSGQSRFWSPLDRLVSFLWFFVCAGLGMTGIFALQAGSVNRLAIIYGLLSGFFHGVAYSIFGGVGIIPGLGVEIKPAEVAYWSSRDALTALPETVRKGLSTVLFFMVSVMIVLTGTSSFFYGTSYGLRYGLIYGIIIGLVGGMAGILTGVLSSGWASDVSDERSFIEPNEGIRRSMRNALIAAGLFGPIGGGMSWLVCSFAFGIVGRIAGWSVLATGFSLVIAVIFALEFALFNGGIATLEHYALRWRLCHTGTIPRNYRAFLDYAAQRILLRKVGAGYIFVHRLLLEHFAAIEDVNTEM